MAGGGGINTDYCEWSSLYILGYVISIFVQQKALNKLMKYKKSQNARTAFAFMVPLTICAFLLAIVSFKNASNDVFIIT